MAAESKATPPSALLARAPAVQALLPFLRGSLTRAKKSELAARVARPAIPLHHHAIRQVVEQLELRFWAGLPAVYVHEGARQSLERRLSQIGRQPVLLSITDNRHSMIHATRKDGLLRARLHHMFLDAPPSVIDALARFLLYRDRDASHVVGRYIDTNSQRIRSLEPHRKSLKSNRGENHDLDAIYTEVNEQYFEGMVDARICWGEDGRTRGRRRSTIKLGSYAAQGRLIRVHPRLDQPWVPRYFIAFVVFHEMLHHVMPATRVGGRRMLHPAEFRAREKAFKGYDKAIAWEKANLDRLLR
ncbi:MAG: hypothetical protein ACXWUG_08600 [Polyangiales bacterium]